MYRHHKSLQRFRTDRWFCKTFSKLSDTKKLRGSYQTSHQRVRAFPTRIRKKMLHWQFLSFKSAKGQTKSPRRWGNNRYNCGFHRYVSRTANVHLRQNTIKTAETFSARRYFWNTWRSSFWKFSWAQEDPCCFTFLTQTCFQKTGHPRRNPLTPQTHQMVSGAGHRVRGFA